MSREVEQVKLEDRSTGQLVDASLYDGISSENLREYDEIWVPRMREAFQRARELLNQGKSVSHPAEDSHWDWTGKVLKTHGSLYHKHYAIECEGKTQGMMQLELSHRSRIEPGQHMVYIDYLSVAPWNRRIIEPKPRFRLVGTVLFNQALGTSDNEGFFGRVGLHALPNAAAWYRDVIKMQSFGQDAEYDNLEYFEIAQENAQKRLKGMVTQ
ncbi:MAG: GNAT family N-acetyltransferase [Bdellovibrionota bacterium]